LDETEGLTSADIVAAISATYGIAEKPHAPADAGQSPNGDGEDVEAPFLAASLEATRLVNMPNFRP
jgi:hypothetical protein